MEDDDVSNVLRAADAFMAIFWITEEQWNC